MVDWVDCWCFREYNRIFQKSAIFWCSGGIFDIAKNGVFHGFQRSVSISVLIQERKMLAPSSRSLSKALFSELSIETLTKVLVLFVLEWESKYWLSFEIREIPRFWPCQKCPQNPQKYPIFEKSDFSPGTISNRPSQPCIIQSVSTASQKSMFLTARTWKSRFSANFGTFWSKSSIQTNFGWEMGMSPPKSRLIWSQTSPQKCHICHLWAG